MKKIFTFILLSIVTISCYDDYVFDFDYSAVYFPHQIDVRSFVVGEGMEIEVGVCLGGVMENTMNRNVTFALETPLIAPAILAQMKGAASYISNSVSSIDELEQMPANYYTLSNSNTIIIESGQHMGSVVVKPDSVAFLSDALTINSKYVLPFTIVTADADSILEDKRYAIIGLRYENMLFGHYWHGGSAIVNRPAMTDSIIIYYTNIPMPESKIWVLKTASPNSLYCNGFLDQTSSRDEMLLTLEGNAITISSVPESTYTILPDGTNTFNRAKLLQDRKIFLKYSFIDSSNGYTYHCTDTLTFRNRIRDGVNEWLDENPSHYN